jgi:ferritin-like metal-binding protein YciE
MMVHQKHLVAWLEDAYGMEMALIPLLKSHASDLKDHPQIQSRLEQHALLTAQHAEMVKELINQHGGNTNPHPGTLINTMEALSKVPTAPHENVLIKDHIIGYVALSLQIAAYKVLVTASKKINEQKMLGVCNQILKDNQEMANWIDQHISIAVVKIMDEEEKEASQV